MIQYINGEVGIQENKNRYEKEEIKEDIDEIIKN